MIKTYLVAFVLLCQLYLSMAMTSPPSTSTNEELPEMMLTDIPLEDHINYSKVIETDKDNSIIPPTQEPISTPTQGPISTPTQEPTSTQPPSMSSSFDPCSFAPINTERLDYLMDLLCKDLKDSNIIKYNIDNKDEEIKYGEDEDTEDEEEEEDAYNSDELQNTNSMMPESSL